MDALACNVMGARIHRVSEHVQNVVGDKPNVGVENALSVVLGHVQLVAVLVLELALATGADRVMPNTPEAGWFIWALMPPTAAIGFGPALRAYHRQLFYPFLLVMAFCTVLLLLKAWAVANEETAPRPSIEAVEQPVLDAPQHRMLEVLRGASIEWGARTLVIMFDGYAFPEPDETDVIGSLNLSKEVFGSAHPENEGAPRVLALLKEIPDKYLRIFPPGARPFGPEFAVQVTDEGARYLRETGR